MLCAIDTIRVLVMLSKWNRFEIPWILTSRKRRPFKSNNLQGRKSIQNLNNIQSVPFLYDGHWMCTKYLGVALNLCLHQTSKDRSSFILTIIRHSKESHANEVQKEKSACRFNYIWSLLTKEERSWNTVRYLITKELEHYRWRGWQ